MTLRKSQGVGMLTVQLFIFAFHLNYVLKSCDHKSCYEEANVLSRTWSQGMEQRDTFVYILMSISKFCSFNKV